MFRFARILASVVLSIAFVAGIGAAAGQFLRGEDVESAYRILGFLVFAFFFVGHVSLPSLAGLIAALAFADRLGFARLWQHVLIWSLAGGWFVLRNPMALLIIAPMGVVYWALAGRAAGTPGLRRADFGAQPRVRKLLFYAGGGYLVFLAAGWLEFGAKLLWVAAMGPHLGEPPFATELERDMSGRMMVATIDFPRAESCLESDAKGDLTRMDWDRIVTTPEATVCMFRLLSAYGDMSRSQDWLEAQGFKLSDRSFNPGNPRVARDGSLRVHARWSIKENGVKFPRFHLFRRIVASIPYEMAVYTAWSADGQTLLWVEVGYLVL